MTAAPSANGSDDDADEEIVQSEPTAIQKADLLITQQWLRLIVWQSSFRQSLLSWTAPHESMHFGFPLAIARSTANVLQSLPSTAVEVHGMGIFEKIFEIGTWCMNVLGAIDHASVTGSPISGIRGTMGMDFVGTGDLGVLGVSRKGVAIDPLEFFVRTLSATPNSRTQFAERLLMFAQERPGGMRMALTPSLGSPILPPESVSWPTSAPRPSNDRDIPMHGNVLGEAVKEELENDLEMEDDASAAWPLTGAIGLSAGSTASVPVPSLLSDPILNMNNYNTAATTRNGHTRRQTAPTSLSMPSLNASASLSNWAGEPMSATTATAAQDWAYDMTSPTMESQAAFSGTVNSAYNSGAGTPVLGAFGASGPGFFARQDSGDSLYTYQSQEEAGQRASNAGVQQSYQQHQPQHSYSEFGTAAFGGAGGIGTTNE